MFVINSTLKNGVIIILCKEKILIHFQRCRVKPAVVEERMWARSNSTRRNTYKKPYDRYSFF